jgi:hypothetical protein
VVSPQKGEEKAHYLRALIRAYLAKTNRVMSGVHIGYLKKLAQANSPEIQG